MSYFGSVSDDENIVHTQNFDESAPIFHEKVSPALEPSFEAPVNLMKHVPESISGVLSQEKFEAILKSYQSSIANKFLNPYTFSIFGLYYAYKGSLGRVERILLGAGALAALFFIVRNQDKKGQLSATNLYNEYVSAVTPKGLLDVVSEGKV